MWNRLWVYKIFMILKYCNRRRALLIQEVKLNSPAGNRSLVSRVTGGDTHHYTTEDCVSWTGCEFINSLWFWSIVIDGIPLLIQGNKFDSPAGNRTLVSRVTRGDTQHSTTEDRLSGTGCEFINSWWFWSNVIDGVLYLYRKINWTPRQGIEPWSPAWQAGIFTTILPSMVYFEQVVSL